jgi:hypothetical protein
MVYEDAEKLYAEVRTDTETLVDKALWALWHSLQVLECTSVPSAWHSRRSQTILADFRNRNDAKVRSSKAQFSSSVTKESPRQRDTRSSYPHHASPKKRDGKLLMERKTRVNLRR